MDRKKLRWNGWGWKDGHFDLGAHEADVWQWLRRELGMAQLREQHPVPLDSIALPASRLPVRLLDRLGLMVGPDQVKIDEYERAFHARGRSYPDLLDLRRGELGPAPDAVVYPRNADEVLAVLRLAQAEGLAVIPFGGGSSVVGGIHPSTGPGQAGVITCDTTLLDRIVDIDPLSLTATIEAGIYGPELERLLGARGFTLGHYPQSFEFSTLGGWIAARGAGQQSHGYGRADQWLISARLATPTGLWRTEPFPASAAGPDLNEFVAGCEGCLGIITDATVHVHRTPEVQDIRGFLFRDFASGADALREISQSDLPVSMLRLSDAEETYFFGTFARTRKPPGAVEAMADQALGLAGYGRGRCMMLVVTEGSAKEVKQVVAGISAITRRNWGFPLGTKVGQSWSKTRFAMPYLRDPLLDRGVGVDTLETSTQWSNVQRLHRDVGDAIADALREEAAAPSSRAMVLCHISHCYADGASLYFTFVFPQAKGRELEQWRAVKTAACDAIADGGGTISHHHGVGIDHAPWLVRDKGEIGVGVLEAVKTQLDPQGILNPGKLLENWRPKAAHLGK